MGFYCLSFFSNNSLAPTVAQTIRSMVSNDNPLFSLPINDAINNNNKETEYKMIIVFLFICKHCYFTLSYLDFFFSSSK